MKKIILFLIRLYQLTLSPFLGDNCRHYPTCSEYSIQSIKKHGLLKGVWLGFKRISRCRPLGSKGYDPVP